MVKCCTAMLLDEWFACEAKKEADKTEKQGCQLVSERVPAVYKPPMGLFALGDLIYLVHPSCPTAVPQPLDGYQTVLTTKRRCTRREGEGGKQTYSKTTSRASQSTDGLAYRFANLPRLVIVRLVQYCSILKSLRELRR